MASLLVGSLPMASHSFTKTIPHTLSFSRSESLISLPLTISSLSLKSASSPKPLNLIYCGRGDRKTARGKRFAHSFGNARPRNKTKGKGPPRVPIPAGSTPGKERFKDELPDIDFELDEDLED